MIMDILPKLHSLVANTLHDVFLLYDGIHKVSLYVMSGDEITEFAHYRDSLSITIIRSDNTDIATATPWKVLEDVVEINSTLCVSQCDLMSDPYIQSNDIRNFICSPIGNWGWISVFLWVDSNVESLNLSVADEQKITHYAQVFENSIHLLGAEEKHSAIEVIKVLLENEKNIATLPVVMSSGLTGANSQRTNEIRIEGLEAVETHLRLYERAVKAANTGVTITDVRLEDLPIIYCNPAFEKITGYSFADTVGRNARFLLGDDAEQIGLGIIREAIVKGAHCKVTLRNYKKDGSLFWNELTLSPIIDSNGFLTHYIGIQNDITARVEAEISLVAARKRASVAPKLLAQAASLANIIGWQFDLDNGQMLVVGDIAELLHKEEKDVSSPSRLFDCVLPSYAESAIEDMDLAIAGKVALDRVLPVVVGDHQEKWIHVTAKLFPVGVVREGGACLAGTLQDVTEFRR